VELSRDGCLRPWVVCGCPLHCVNCAVHVCQYSNLNSERSQKTTTQCKLHRNLLVKLYGTHVSLPCSQIPSLYSVLSSMNPFHVSILYFLKIHFNITHPFMPRSFKWPFSFRVSGQTIVCISDQPYRQTHM
jgi:hypothetical protein